MIPLCNQLRWNSAVNTKNSKTTDDSIVHIEHLLCFFHIMDTHHLSSMLRTVHANSRRSHHAIFRLRHLRDFSDKPLPRRCYLHASPDTELPTRSGMFPVIWLNRGISRTSRQFCSVFLANPSPGSTTIFHRGTPMAISTSALCLQYDATSRTTSSYRAIESIVVASPRLCMSTTGTPASARNGSMAGSFSPAEMSLTRSAPASTALRATSLWYVSTEMGTRTPASLLETRGRRATGARGSPGSRAESLRRRRSPPRPDACSRRRCRGDPRRPR